MKCDVKTYEAALQKLDEYMQEKNMRRSTVRNIVLEHLCSLKQPFTAEQLVEVCQNDRISVGTVYNCLTLFISAHILYAIDRQRGQAATEYELAISKHNRLQIVCTKCGRVTPFRDKAIESLIRERKYTNFNLARYSLLIYGECKLCRRKIKD